jgi:hypothetical protein
MTPRMLPPDKSPSFAAMQRAVAQNQRFLQRTAGWGSVQRMKRINDGTDQNPQPSQKAVALSPAQRKQAVIDHIIRLIWARLGNNHQQPPKLSELVSSDLAKRLGDLLGEKNKRGWQFASIGVITAPPVIASTPVGFDVSGGLGTVTYASNNMQSVNWPHPYGGIVKMTEMNNAKTTTIKPGGRSYHTETRQLHEGCGSISVTGGLNCIFCALYRLHRGQPYQYHTGAIASWHLPEALTITQFFGAAIAAYVQTAAFTNEYGHVGTAQALIDILCNATQFWPQ